MTAHTVLHLFNLFEYILIYDGYIYASMVNKNMGNMWKHMEKKTQGYNKSALLFDPTIEKIKPLHGLSLQMGCILYSDIYGKSNHNMGKGSELCTPKIDQNLAQKTQSNTCCGPDSSNHDICFRTICDYL